MTRARDIANFGDGIATADIGDGQVTDAKINGMSSSKLSGALPAIDGSSLTGISGGKILQVVSSLYQASGSMSISADTWTAVSGLSATITPSAASSKILMIARVGFEWDSGDVQNLNFAPARGGSRFNVSTATFSGSDSLHRAMGSVANASTDTNTTPDFLNLQTLDSPSTTSATTYTVQVANTNNGGALYLNRTVSTTNANSAGMSSEIILMEIGA